MNKNIIHILPETPSNFSESLAKIDDSAQEYVSNYPKRAAFCRKKLTPQLIFLIFFAALFFILLIPKRQHFLYGLSDDKIREFNEIFEDLNATEKVAEHRLEKWAQGIPTGNSILWWQWHAEREFTIRENRRYHFYQIGYLKNPVAKAIDVAIIKILDDEALPVAQKHHQLSLIIEEAKSRSPFALHELETTYLIFFEKLLCFYGQTRQNCNYKLFSRPSGS